MDIRPRQTTAGGGICRALNPLEDQDLPDKLPNPEALTIAGPDGNDTYDGSTAKTISAEAIGAIGNRAKLLTGDEDILRLPCGTYYYGGIVPAGKNYPGNIVGTFAPLFISVIGADKTIPSVGLGYSFVLVYNTYGALYFNGYVWDTPGRWYMLSGTQV